MNSLLVFLLGGVAALAGCNHTPPVAAVSGKVLYNGEPLPYGNIVFQPQTGQPGGAWIQPDGTFKMSTYAEYDGAVPGSHKIAVTCFTSHSPSAKAKAKKNDSLGAMLLPAAYATCDQSGLTAEVPAGGIDSLVFELKGPPHKFPK